MNESQTLSVSIRADAGRVYDFVSDGANLPQWAPGFCRSVRPSAEGWLAETPQGRVTIRIAARNAFGIVDHDVIPGTGPAVHVPMRVVPNGAGAEVVFTLFRSPDMSQERFDQDLRLVRQDLDALKRVMEGNGGP